MERIRRFIILPVLLAVAGAIAFAGPARADVLLGNYNMCGTTALYCFNNWNGTVSAGKDVRLYAYGAEPNNDWNIWTEGYVSATWPWAPTNQYFLDSAYKGDPVYKFAWAPNGKGSGWCIDQRNFDASTDRGNATLQPCQPTSKFPTYQYFVYNGSDLIAVWATGVSVDDIGGGGFTNISLDANVGNGAYLYIAPKPSVYNNYGWNIWTKP